MLAPKDNRYELPEATEELGAGDTQSEEGSAEKPNPFGRSLFPSSMGMTFAVRGDVAKVRLTVRWGRYAKGSSETGFVTPTGAPRSVWQRSQIEAQLEIELKEGKLEDRKPLDDYDVIVTRNRATAG